MPLVTPADRRWKVGVYVARGPAGKGSHGNMRVSSSSPTKKHRVHRRVREERSERAWRAAPSAVLDPAPSAVVRQLSISAALRQGVGGAQSRPPSAANASPGAAYVPTTEPRPQRRAGETANHGILRHRYTTTNETADGRRRTRPTNTRGGRAHGIVENASFLRFLRLGKEESQNRFDSTLYHALRSASKFLSLPRRILVTRVRCEPLGRNEQQNEPSYRFSLVPGETPTTQVIIFRTSSRLRS